MLGIFGAGLRYEGYSLRSMGGAEEVHAATGMVRCLGRAIDWVVLSAMTNRRHDIPSQHRMPQGVRGQISPDGGKLARPHNSQPPCRRKSVIRDSKLECHRVRMGRFALKNGGSGYEDDCGQCGRGSCAARDSLGRPASHRRLRGRPAAAHATRWTANDPAGMQSNAGCCRSGVRS